MARLRVLLPLLLLAAASFAGEALFLRDPAISPDGTRIAFSWKGDLWVVPAVGGEAKPVTSHVAHERLPVWSPDGLWIAFASDRHGNYDVFLVPASGGPEERLTFHSAHDLPSCFGADGLSVLFTSTRQDAPEAALASPGLPELWSAPVKGGRATLVLTTPAEEARLSPDGTRIAYQDLKGFENRYRKHHVSPVARDVWIHDLATGKHRRLTDFGGEDRHPAWSADGLRVWYLSEQGGSFNVWSRAADGSGAAQQHTRHGPHPCRSLSITRDGATLCYAYNGEIWTCPAAGEPRKVIVTARAGDRVNPATLETFRAGATEMAVAPSEEEVAFVVRGEVFVASVEHGTTRRLTDTPEQERSLSWAPDGRAIYFAGERDGAWNLYRVVLAREDDSRFFHASSFREEPVLVGPEETFQPVVSPDGKRLAYLHERDEIRVLDLGTKASKTLVPADRNYSYADGDIEYAWSPDSRWLAFQMGGEGNRIDDIGIANLESGEIVNLTLSGYNEAIPQWSADGGAIVFWSDRHGRRSHGGWGSEADIVALDLTREAHDRATLGEEDFAILKKQEEEKKKKDKEKDKEKKKGEGEGEEKGKEGDKDKDGNNDDRDKDKEKGKGKEKEEPKPVRIELEGREERFRRLTLHSAPMGRFALSPDGEQLAFTAEVNGDWSLWLHEIRKGDTKRVEGLGREEPGEVRFADEGKAIFVRGGKGGILRIDVKGGKSKPVPYAAEMVVRAPEERAYVFEHCWRQAKKKFYEPSMHGADWDGLKRNYRAFLPHVDNNQDFAALLSEMAGELNASHTGCGYRIPQDGADETASLGLLFDPRAPGDVLEVAEVLEGGPADRADSRLRPGARITHVDGVRLAPEVDVDRLLNRKAGRRVLVTFTLPGEDAAIEEVLKPVSPEQEDQLLYGRWVRQRRDLTEKLSGGRVGYVHVRSMGDRSFRTLYQEALGRHGAKEALLVDTRFNGGGWLHDDLVTFLGAKVYLTHHPRGKERGTMGSEPHNRWTRPVAVLMSEGNYSDAHVFPYAFQKLGLGKLVGTPVAGTGTAVWWERQIDPTLTFGIPQIGLVTDDGRYLENLPVEPDVPVENDPESVAQGRDLQLEKGVETLLAELAK